MNFFESHSDYAFSDHAFMLWINWVNQKIVDENEDAFISNTLDLISSWNLHLLISLTIERKW